MKERKITYKGYLITLRRGRSEPGKSHVVASARENSGRGNRVIRIVRALNSVGCASSQESWEQTIDGALLECKDWIDEQELIGQIISTTIPKWGQVIQ
jgi:hypothetical protein